MSTSHFIELQGVVHGKTIELLSETGLPDGQAVTLMVRPKLPPGEGLRRSAGAWADGGEELDRWQEETYRARREDPRNSREL